MPGMLNSGGLRPERVVYEPVRAGYNMVMADSSGKTKEEKKLRAFFEEIARDRNEMALAGLKKRMILSVIFLVVQCALLLAGIEMEVPMDFQAALMLIPLIALNSRCYIDGFQSIRTRQPEKNILAAIGSILAIVSFHFVAASVVLTTMALCRYCEAYVRFRLNSHLNDLVEAEPDDGKLHEGDILTIGAGEIIPVDGVILSGGTMIDEELITGERILSGKKDGHVVFAGTGNVGSEISIRVMHTGKDRMIARLIDHISQATLTRSPRAAKAEKTARWFVAAVLAAAVISTAVWTLMGVEFKLATLTGIAALIIANPYAFSVALPMSVLASVVRGAEQGILIRSADILEDARDINTIVMNKTGTITAGDPEISDVISLRGDFTLKLAGALERGAKHPYGRMIWQTAVDRYGDLPEGQISEYVEGRGICSNLEGRSYLVGNALFMKERQVPVEGENIRNLFLQGKSVIFFAEGSEVIGVIALRDMPKPSSLKAITLIEGMGIDVGMLTGDSRQTAEAIRGELGIDHIFADILPRDKKQIVEKIRREKRKIVAMVGDGVHDAPVIEAADLGIAIGTGKDIYIGPGDIILISDDLLDVVRAMRLAHLTSRNLRQSIAFAYIYNIVAVLCTTVVIAAFSQITMAPAVAALIMCASQILVVFNTLRIGRAHL